MNTAERAYFERELMPVLLSGRIRRVGFEDTTFVLANGCRYTPDFSAVYDDGACWFIDVKPAWKSKGSDTYAIQPEDDALVKIKVAAQQRPEFYFKMVALLPKKAGGGWIEREIEPR